MNLLDEIFSQKIEKTEKITSMNKVYEYSQIELNYQYIKDNIFPHCENEYIELKDKDLTKQELSVILSGFANYLGGSLFIGITDARIIKGKIFTSSTMDQFRLMVDDVTQNYIHPTLLGTKIHFIQILDPNMHNINDTYVVRIDIPKVGENMCCGDGEVYIRQNASFRKQGIKTFIRYSEYKGLEEKYATQIKKHETLLLKYNALQNENDKLNQRKLSLEEQLDELREKLLVYQQCKRNEEKVNAIQKKIIELENKVYNYEFIFGITRLKQQQ
jgi:predicted HTH transcriptional regulator